MNREILFKAKTKMTVRTYNNGLDDGKWVQGYLRCDCGMWLIYQFEYDRADQVAYEVDPDTICQYTGLVDKNDNKIWENDIVKKHFYTNHEAFANSEEYIGKVEYLDCAWNITFDKEGHKCVSPIFMAIEFKDADHYEVIGNVFDDTELLKNEKIETLEVVDVTINTFGGYCLKYSDGSTTNVCKEHLIKMLNSINQEEK